MVRTHAYGPGADQVADLRLPSSGAPAPVALLLHGGFWRIPWARDLMDGLADGLSTAGWATWNVEYRRVGAGGGVPATLDDVLAAHDHLEDIDAPLDRSRVIAVGHSAGGHLALWLASQRPLALAVSLGGVTSLAAAERLRLGADAVRDLCGGSPAAAAAAYALADPFERLPLGVAQLIVHGADDDTVPVELARLWAERAAERGDHCELVVLPGVGHFELIDPDSAAWAAVSARLPAGEPGAGSM